jgi:hypothetical protein
MRNSLILLALSGVSLTVAFHTLTVSSTIAANTTSNLAITNDLSNGASSFDGSFSSFRTYLAITAPGFDLVPACYLVNSSAINTTSLSFEIPASVGPDGSSYSIATMEFNQNPYASGPSSYEYSNSFILTNATGSWTAAELAGKTVGEPDNVPCTAYNCARNCTQTFYSANNDTAAGTKSTYECTAACPGVTYESWVDLLEDECKTDAGTASSSSACAAASSASVSAASSASVAATHTTSPPTTSTSSTTSATSTPTKSKSGGSQISAVRVTLLSTFVLAAFSI